MSEKELLEEAGRYTKAVVETMERQGIDFIILLPAGGDIESLTLRQCLYRSLELMRQAKVKV